MLKKTITFNDLDGNPITEDFYFNLSVAEIAELEMGYKDGFSNHLLTIGKGENGDQIMAAFKDLITKTVGRRSEDGRRFIKSQEITDDFLQTDAYSQLFIELLTEPNAGVEFVKAIVPTDLAKKIEEMPPGTQAEAAVPEEPAWIREDRDPTPAEVKSMSQEQLAEAFRKRLDRLPATNEAVN